MFSTILYIFMKLLITKLLLLIILYVLFSLRRDKDSSISVEDLLYDIFKHNESDHLVVGDFLSVSNSRPPQIFLSFLQIWCAVCAHYIDRACALYVSCRSSCQNVNFFSKSQSLYVRCLICCYSFRHYGQPGYETPILG